MLAHLLSPAPCHQSHSQMGTEQGLISKEQIQAQEDDSISNLPPASASTHTMWPLVCVLATLTLFPLPGEAVEDGP